MNLSSKHETHELPHLRVQKDRVPEQGGHGPQLVFHLPWLVTHFTFHPLHVVGVGGVYGLSTDRLVWNLLMAVQRMQDFFHGQSAMKNCQHNKSMNEHCIECEIVWHEWCLREAQQSVAAHQNKLAELRQSHQTVLQGDTLSTDPPTLRKALESPWKEP